MATSDEFPELWHYTTLEGLKGIYETQVLWATDCRDLNDTSELTRFRRVAERFASEHVKLISPVYRESSIGNHRTSLDQEIAQGSAQLLDIFDRVTFGKTGVGFPYVCSFCYHPAKSYEAENGLLSQWRGYGGAGGIAIVFDTRKIEEGLAAEASTFHHPVNHIGNVCYDNADVTQAKDFAEFFEHLPYWMNAIVNRAEPDDKVVGQMLPAFVKGATLVKHYAFHEEREVRIVVCPRSQSVDSIFFDPNLLSEPEKRLCFRKRGVDEVRYIELFNRQGGAPLPIRKIVVGPSRTQNFNFQFAQRLLKETPIEVVKSDIPYVG